MRLHLIIYITSHVLLSPLLLENDSAPASRRWMQVRLKSIGVASRLIAAGNDDAMFGRSAAHHVDTQIVL